MSVDLVAYIKQALVFPLNEFREFSESRQNPNIVWSPGLVPIWKQIHYQWYSRKFCVITHKLRATPGKQKQLMMDLQSSETILCR